MEVARGGDMWPDVAMVVLSLTAASGPHEDGGRKKIWVLAHIGQDGYCPLQPKISVDVTPKPGCVLFGPHT